jgi:hypothetical protein
MVHIFNIFNCVNNIIWTMQLEQNYSGPLLPSSSSQLTQYQLDRRHGFFGYPKTESYCCFEMTRHVTKTRRAELKTLYLDEQHKYISRPLHCVVCTCIQKV